MNEETTTLQIMEKIPIMHRSFLHTAPQSRRDVTSSCPQYIYILYYPLIVVSFIVIFAAFCTRLLDVAISLTGIAFVVAFLCGSQPASTTLCRFRCLVSLTKSGNKGLLPASRQGILKKTNQKGNINVKVNSQFILLRSFLLKICSCIAQTIYL